MREKFLNSASQSVTKHNPASFRNTFAISPYSARFCRENAPTLTCNDKKINHFQNLAPNGAQNIAANSLFRNILRVSPSGSRFCLKCRRSAIRNINRMNILQTAKKKVGGGASGSVRDSGLACGQQKRRPERSRLSDPLIVHRTEKPSRPWERAVLEVILQNPCGQRGG